MTEQEYIETLGESDQRFIALSKSHLGENTLDSYTAILVDGEVVKVSMIVSMLWDYHNPGARIIAKTNIGDREVSTVFLTVGHNDGKQHFETMVFPNGRTRVYSTLEEAKAGHEDLVAYYKS
jgi:hypothetical protein